MKPTDYGLELVTAPAEFMQAADVQAWCRIAKNDENVLIQDTIRDAVELIEAHTGKQLLTATWRLYLDGFPQCIQLVKGPWLSVVSVKYYDVAGTLTTLATTEYDVDLIRGRVTPAYLKVWPTPREVLNAVRVEFTSGHAATSQELSVYRMCVRAICSDAIENRRLIYELPNGVKQRLAVKTGKDGIP